MHASHNLPTYAPAHHDSKQLSDKNLLLIIAEKCTDMETNYLVWKCLGYRYDANTDAWSASAVFPKWRERFPEPPDLVGVQRIYLPEIDKPVLKANQALVRALEISRGDADRLPDTDHFFLAHMPHSRKCRSDLFQWTSNSP